MLLKVYRGLLLVKLNEICCVYDVRSLIAYWYNRQFYSNSINDIWPEIDDLSKLLFKKIEHS